MTKDNSIRVLYKKPKQTPEVKFVDVFKLKNFIEQKNLNVIPYEKLFIICNKNKSASSDNFNIVLPFSNISGDLILVAKDDSNEFKGLSVEDVNWYTTDLINKSFNNLEKSNNNNKTTRKTSNSKFNNSTTSTKSNEQPISNNNLDNLTTFEKNLLGVLASISLTLSNLLKEKIENE